MKALAEFIEERRDTPFEWGKSDCCLVMADWVLLRSGVDIMAQHRGTYAGWKQAARLWRELGGLEVAVCEALDEHFDRVPRYLARPGDVAIVQTHRRACTAAIVDVIGLWAPTQTGLVLCNPSTRPKTFWRIQ